REPAGRAALAAATAGATRLGGRVVDYAGTGEARFASADGRTAYALVFLPPTEGQTSPLEAPVSAALERAAPAGWRVGFPGFGPLQSAGGQPSGPGVLVETIVGGAGALLVLAFVFASFVAVVPLVTAAVSIMVTFLLLLGLTELTSVNFIAQF